jgi:hypothetical protein
MEKAFLETNAICRFLNEKLSGEEIRALLSCYKYKPVIGFHVIYELARTFLSSNKDEIAKTLFEIVRDLNPDISEEPKVILPNEYNWYSNGIRFDCFLSGMRKYLAREEIVKLAMGVFDDSARTFISSRDMKFKEEHPVMGREQVNIFLNNPPVKKLHSFEDVVKYYESDIPILIEQIYKGAASTDEAKDMAGKIDQFPCLKATVMANLYLDFIVVVHKTPPATDKVDDHRHIVDASYCDVFVTEENQLLANVPRINSRLKPIKWSTIGKGIVEVKGSAGVREC